MLNDFIGGGQIFLHKIRMFLQVVNKTLGVACLIGGISACLYVYQKLRSLDTKAAISYQKAIIVVSMNDGIQAIRLMMNPDVKINLPTIDAYTQKGLYVKGIEARRILRNNYFKTAYDSAIALLLSSLLIACEMFSSVFVMIFIIWTKFGKAAKGTKHLSGSVIKTVKEVTAYLKSINRVSEFRIGDMPFVKDTETRHILVTGMTGSGKTNLINTLLPQVKDRSQPAIVIDQTGEMIARYYNSERGDIIFNPLDARSHTWDFWTDITSESSFGNIDPRLEKFAKVLFKFGKRPNSNSDPFWDNSAEAVFCACVESLLKSENKSLRELQRMLSKLPMNVLADKLKDTKAARYLVGGNYATANSILSVLTTGSKPLQFLYESEKRFSIKQYFEGVSNGQPSWLFFSTPPSQREVILPLMGCLFELAISFLIGIGINERRRVWFVIDELAALGRLNGFNVLINESRKYGGCVLAATQSVNQLFENFGHYAGNTIFGQFATKFIFRSDEPLMAKLVSDIFGQVEYKTQQKNTSYGAHEHRDGVSYTEQEKRKSLINADDLARLADLECFVGLPEPEIRIAKIKVPPVINEIERNPGFVPIDPLTFREVISNNINELEINSSLSQSNIDTTKEKNEEIEELFLKA